MMQKLHTPPIDLGDGYSVEFHFDGTRLVVEWSPDMPGPAGKRLIGPYIRARDAFLEEVARANGMNMAVVNI